MLLFGPAAYSGAESITGMVLPRSLPTFLQATLNSSTFYRQDSMGSSLTKHLRPASETGGKSQTRLIDFNLDNVNTKMPGDKQNVCGRCSLGINWLMDSFIECS